MQWNEFSFRIRHLKTAEQKMIQKAFSVAEKAHEGQLRQSGEPYFSHPIAVAQILNDMNADADTIAAALLHDTVEDTTVTLLDIESTFNPVVASLVDGVTKLNKQELAIHPTLDGQIETLRKMFILMQKDVRIMVIKLADRLHNMQTLGFRSPAKQEIVAKETLDVYVKIADRLCMRDIRDTLEDMCFAILEPQMHEHIIELRKKNEVRTQEKIHFMSKVIETAYPKIDLVLHYETKSWSKLRLQYEMEGEEPTGLSSMNIVIICKDINECYRMFGILHQLWSRETMTFEDFINAPVINGYKGLHTTILLKDGTRMRCKMRTPDMELYAHKGITLLCFNKKQQSLNEYLPWVEHISSLSADTERDSGEFWQSLQTDILGESIIVHGPSSQTVLVPKGATVLDGAFYVFGKEALRITDIQMNGKQMSFYDELQNAVTLRGTFANEVQTDLSWLQYVHTGMALATIRTELVQASASDKKSIGKQLLERAILRSGHTALEELAPSTIRERLSFLRLTSLTQLYIGIAEGKLDAETIAENFFARKRSPGSLSEWTLRIQSVTDLNESLEKIIRSHPFSKIKVVRSAKGMVSNIRYLITPQQARALQTQLASVLPTKQWQMFETWKSKGVMIAIAMLLILWGLDPVFARLLLLSTVHPFDLTLIRFMTFFAASILTYGFQSIFGKQKLRALSPFQPSLILSGIALFITGLFTYMTLIQMPASQYIMFIVAGVVLTNLLSAIVHQKPWRYFAISFTLLLLGLCFLLAIQSQSAFSILSATAASLGFALYSVVSRRYQEEDMTIQARYPAFMFWISCICLILSIALLPFLHYSYPSFQDMLKTIGFSIVFAVIPYVLFFETTRRSESKILDHALPFVVISTIVSEALLTFSISSFFAVPVLFIFLWTYIQNRNTAN
jgi:guanosine-3',5'-bis(diphosphate) 3'-pyrophosphohydrolase